MTSSSLCMTTKISPQCEHLTPPEAPFCDFWVLAILAAPTHPNQTVQPSQLPHTSSWHAKASLYQILSQTIPI
jgi:hypothetical protein